MDRCLCDLQLQLMEWYLKPHLTVLAYCVVFMTQNGKYAYILKPTEYHFRATVNGKLDLSALLHA